MHHRNRHKLMKRNRNEAVDETNDTGLYYSFVELSLKQKIVLKA